jgi:RimJ/RimL family protein N-acetyltransferase
MEPITLTTGRLLLRAFTEDDADEVHRLCQDPDIQRWTTVPVPYEHRHAADFTAEIVPEGWHTGTMCTFALLPRDGGPVMGSMSLTLRDLTGIWEIGYWTGREYRGRGYTAEAVEEVARWAFTTLAATRLEWRAETGNTASRAVAERSGFTMEGTLRSALLQRDTLRDVWVGSLLPSDLGLPGRYAYLRTAGPDGGPGRGGGDGAGDAGDGPAGGTGGRVGHGGGHGESRGEG